MKGFLIILAVVILGLIVAGLVGIALNGFPWADAISKAAAAAVIVGLFVAIGNRGQK